MFGSEFAKQFGIPGPPQEVLGDTAAALSPAGALAQPQLVQVSADRPYQNVPEQLMGFPKEGQAKPYEELKYRHSQPVEVTFPPSELSPEGQTFRDEVSGLNKTHAIERAYRNWPGARIVPLETHGPMHESGSGMLAPGMPMPLE